MQLTCLEPSLQLPSLWPPTQQLSDSKGKVHGTSHHPPGLSGQGRLDTSKITVRWVVFSKWRLSFLLERLLLFIPSGAPPGQYTLCIPEAGTGEQCQITPSSKCVSWSLNHGQTFPSTVCPSSSPWPKKKDGASKRLTQSWKNATLQLHLFELSGLKSLKKNYRLPFRKSEIAENLTVWDMLVHTGGR